MYDGEDRQARADDALSTLFDERTPDDSRPRVESNPDSFILDANIYPFTAGRATDVGAALNAKRPSSARPPVARRYFGAHIPGERNEEKCGIARTSSRRKKNIYIYTKTRPFTALSVTC